MRQRCGCSGVSSAAGLARRLLLAAGGFALGAVATLIFSWFAFMAPLQESVAARERAVREWEQMNRDERQAIRDVKHLSVEELRKWSGAVTEQNARFAEIQRQLHQQEVELAGPGTSFVVIAAVVVLGVVAFTWLMVRDSSNRASVTLENITALGPGQIVTVVRGDGDARRGRLAGATPAPGALPEPALRADSES